MKINGKDFKELTLRQKILAVAAVPFILLSTFAVLFIVLGIIFAGVAGILAVTFLIVTVIVIISVPIALFRKIKRGIMKHEK